MLLANRSQSAPLLALKDTSLPQADYATMPSLLWGHSILQALLRNLT